MNDQTQELQTIYQQRFEGAQAYRNQVWQVLIRHFFQKFIPRDAAVLDLGCGYGEFINQVSCRKKYGMDLNPTTARVLATDVQFLQQDCSSAWSLPENSLDVVFTSNFF
jgi:SAM-dependent methyltransferase